MNVLNTLVGGVTPSSSHDEIAYTVSSDEESAFVAVTNGNKSSSRRKRVGLVKQTNGCLSEDFDTANDLDDGVLSLISSETSSSTASTCSSSTGTFPDHPVVVYGARRQRADIVRSVFQDPTLWRCFDNFQVEYCGGLQDPEDYFPSMSIHRGDPWPFESEVVKDHVAVAVEVGDATL
jgi:hypothetical protein